MNKNAVVITGCAGFIGSHLTRHFLDRGYRVYGIDNFCTGLKSNVEKHLSDQFHFFELDACAPWNAVAQKIQIAGDKIESVFHFASPASPPLYQIQNMETLHVNSIGLENALHFATEHQSRCIFASTSEVYGDPDIHPQPESYWGYVNSYGERSCYDEAKRFGEALIFSFNKRYKTSHGLVRIFNTYGPWMNPDDGRVVINFIHQALRGAALTIYGNGLQTRSFCYIDDLVAGITAYAQTSLVEPINLGNPTEFTILQLAEEVQKLFPEKKLLIEHKALPQDDPQQRRPNIDKALQNLSPWRPSITLNEGLKRTKSWLESLKIHP